MAEIGKLEITVLDTPEVQRLLKRYKKIQRRRAWKNHARTKKVRNSTWKKKAMMPINNQIEPDFLEHIKSTFKRWRDLNTQGVTIGARELSNFAFTLKGASMNSHLGFKYNFNPRGTDADGNPAITLKLYTKPEQMNPAADRPVYEFAAPYMV